VSFFYFLSVALFSTLFRSLSFSLSPPLPTHFTNWSLARGCDTHHLSVIVDRGAFPSKMSTAREGAKNKSAWIISG
jgi:hypothetical protein